MLIYKTTKKSLYILKTEAEAKQKQSEAKRSKAEAKRSRSEAESKAKRSEAEAKQKRIRAEAEANQSIVAFYFFEIDSGKKRIFFSKILHPIWQRSL